MKFVRLGMGGGVEFRVRHRDGPEACNRRHQGFFLGSKNAVLPRINQDRTLGSRSAKGRGNQHSGRNQTCPANAPPRQSRA